MPDDILVARGACLSDHHDLLRFLLSLGANPDAKGSGGLTLLTIASQDGRLETMKILIDGGARVDGID